MNEYMSCAHEFAKDGWQRWETWLPRRKWRCVACGFETRTYDGVDRMAMRPVHPHMSVAVPGFNTRVTPPTDRGNANLIALLFAVAVCAPLGAIRWLGPTTAGLLVVVLALAWLAIGCCMAGAGLRERLDAEAPTREVAR